MRASGQNMLATGGSPRYICVTTAALAVATLLAHLLTPLGEATGVPYELRLPCQATTQGRVAACGVLIVESHVLSSTGGLRRAAAANRVPGCSLPKKSSPSMKYFRNPFIDRLGGTMGAGQDSKERRTGHLRGRDVAVISGG